VNQFRYEKNFEFIKLDQEANLRFLPVEKSESKMTLNLDIIAKDSIQIKNDNLNLLARGNLKLTGVADNPTIDGEIQSNVGKIEAYIIKLHLEKARFIFQKDKFSEI